MKKIISYLGRILGGILIVILILELICTVIGESTNISIDIEKKNIKFSKDSLFKAYKYDISNKNITLYSNSIINTIVGYNKVSFYYISGNRKMISYISFDVNNINYVYSSENENDINCNLFPLIKNECIESKNEYFRIIKEYYPKYTKILEEKNINNSVSK
jgi:hypothetical protein